MDHWTEHVGYRLMKSLTNGICLRVLCSSDRWANIVSFKTLLKVSSCELGVSQTIASQVATLREQTSCCRSQ